MHFQEKKLKVEPEIESEGVAGHKESSINEEIESLNSEHR